jgi:hypothetical protein
MAVFGPLQVLAMAHSRSTLHAIPHSADQAWVGTTMIKRALRCCPCDLVLMPALVVVLALLGDWDRAWQDLLLLAAYW